MRSPLKQRAWRWSSTLILIGLCSPSLCATARKSDAWAHSEFAAAEHKQEVLHDRPSVQQTRHEYLNVIDAYRRVYYGSPTSTKADASVSAVADLMVEMGRRFQDPGVLRSAIVEYEFLRRQYPGSKYRFEALLNIARIYRDDLHEDALARETFEEFVKRYPHHPQCGMARDAIAALDSPEKDAVAATPQTSADNNESPPAKPAIEDGKSIARQLPNIGGIRHWSTGVSSRVAVDLDGEVRFKSHRIDNPNRIFFDLDAKLAKKLIGETVNVHDELLKKIRVAQFSAARARIVLEVEDNARYTASLEKNPPQLMIEITQSNADAQADISTVEAPSPAIEIPDQAPMPNAGSLAVASAPISKRIVEAEDSPSESASVPKQRSRNKNPVTVRPVQSRHHNKSLANLTGREAQPDSSGDRSLIRALGLKIGKIVIDPGHGGHDTGTIGPNSLEEKDLVLDVSRRLGKLLESRLGAEVVFTRKDDTFVPLETRTAIANREQADLFVSVHANSSHDPSARGVETYYLNFNSSPDALEVAARENAVSETSIHELQDLVKQIALKEKIEESREFASDVQQELQNGLAKNSGVPNRGVKKAPFIVLIGANMPSILAEISFVSNPGDERRLETAAYRQRIAESLYRGISKYVSGLSGVKVASKIEKNPM